MSDEPEFSYKLTVAQWKLLCEALHRYVFHHSGRPFTMPWAGLGYKTTYRPVLDAGLMEWSSGSPPRPRHVGWLKLTEKGAAIVRRWIFLGYGELDFTKPFTRPDCPLKRLPPRRMEDEDEQL